MVSDGLKIVMNNSPKKNGFTLIELLVVIVIIAVLVGILLPSLTEARNRAKSITCRSNLKEMALGFMMYLEDNDGYVFPLIHYGRADEGELGKYWYFGFETVSSSTMPEGSRQIDRDLAKLYPYIGEYDSVEICPAFPYKKGNYKPKYTTRWMTYGINAELSPNMTFPGRKVVKFEKKIKSTHKAVLFADTAQVTYWHQPASFSNPMFEEWHYVETDEATVHFRHNSKANILYADTHVDSIEPAKGSFGTLLPQLKIGRFTDRVKFE